MGGRQSYVRGTTRTPGLLDSGKGFDVRVAWLCGREARPRRDCAAEHQPALFRVRRSPAGVGHATAGGTPPVRGLANRSEIRRYGSADVRKRSYYYGVIAWDGTLYDHALLRERTGQAGARIQHEPLISQALFERVQEMMYGRKKGPNRRARLLLWRLPSDLW